MLRSRWIMMALVLIGAALSAPVPAQDTKSKDKADQKATDAKAADKAAPTTAATGDKVEIKWKFEKDKPFYQEMTTETDQNMKVMGMEVNQKQKQTFYFSWTYKEDDKDKNMVMVQKIEGVKLTIDIAGNPINFDSTNPAAQNTALAEFFKALVGSEFRLTLDPKDLKVLKVEGRDEFLKKLGTTNQTMEPLLKRILNEDALKQMADPTFGIAPNQPEAKGGTWTRDSKLSLGPIGSYKNTYKYTYEGQDDKNKDIAKIKVDTTLTYEPPTDPGEGLPFRIKEAKLTSKDASGDVRFDVKKGRLEESNLKLKLEGDLTIEIGGMASKVELKQSQTTKVTTSDSPQIKKS